MCDGPPNRRTGTNRLGFLFFLIPNFKSLRLFFSAENGRRAFNGSAQQRYERFLVFFFLRGKIILLSDSQFPQIIPRYNHRNRVKCR